MGLRILDKYRGVVAIAWQEFGRAGRSDIGRQKGCWLVERFGASLFLFSRSIESLGNWLNKEIQGLTARLSIVISPYCLIVVNTAFNPAIF